MARIVRFHETGGPEVLRFEDVSATPQAGEVAIKVEAIGLNRAEIAFRMGAYLERPQLPSRIGYEAAGVVTTTGADVSSLRVGDRVAVIPNFSMTQYGTYGEEIVVPTGSAMPIPPGIDSVTAAALWMAYLTAYGGLIEVGGLRDGEFVLIPAASSSVGLAAIQVALCVGAVPIAVTRSGAKREALQRHGAAHVIVTEQDDLVAEVRRITNKAGARLVFDPVAGPLVDQLAKATASGGLVLIYGGLSGKSTSFPGGLAMARALTFRGYTLFEVTNNQDKLRRATAFILDGLTSGQLRPVIDRTFTFDQLPDAHRYMEASGQIGKIVVTVGGG